MAKQTATDPRKVKTEKARLSYAAIFKVNKFGHFGADLLIPKDADISEIRAARDAVLKQHASFGPKKDKWPKGWKNPIKDGDHEKFADKEGYADHWVVRCKANESSPPQIVDRKGKTWAKRDGIQSGDYVIAYLYASAFDQNGNKGAKFNLDAIQFVEKGEPLSKRAQLQFDPIQGGDESPDSGSEDSDDNDDDSDVSF